MAEQILDEVLLLQNDDHEQPGNALIACSVGIMAYNEEANISRTVGAILQQQSPSISIQEIIVVASGCTDNTIPIVTELARHEPLVRLCIQEKREGKASAINLFLKQAISPVVVLIGADVIPDASAIEYLCAPFADARVGMVGGRPIPVNDSSTFMGHSVHLLWRLHDYLARIDPKLGEVIAFRNVISGIPMNSSVDEISIQALISQLGYQLLYESSCIVYNKGPLTIRDFLKQRRRIFAGHLQVREQQSYAASTMQIVPIARQLFACRDVAFSTPRQALWSAGTVLLEGIARLQGYYDHQRKHEHQVWQMVYSTKDLEAGAAKVRRLCNAQSVLVFRLIIEGGQGYGVNQERQDREATEAARKLLPLLRSRLRKADKLFLNGPGIMTAVIRAEQHGAELVAQRIQEALQTTPARIGLRGREIKVVATYSSLTFALQGKKGKTIADAASAGETAPSTQPSMSRLIPIMGGESADG